MNTQLTILVNGIPIDTLFLEDAAAKVLGRHPGGADRLEVVVESARNTRVDVLQCGVMYDAADPRGVCGLFPGHDELHHTTNRQCESVWW